MDGLLGTLCAFVCESINWNIACHVTVEIVLLAVIIWLLFRNSYEITETHKLSAREIDELIMEWKAEPLTPPVDPDTPALRRPYVERQSGGADVVLLLNDHGQCLSKFGKCLRVDGEDYLNFGTMDFLGLASEPSIEDAAVEALHRFGTGTCGPRAFYGTLDIHMVLEERIATFMRCEEAIVYSYGFATIASAIPAYCKRGDVIFVDRGVNFAIQKGLQASRSRIEFFNHNDMKHLRYLLEQQAEKDLSNPDDRIAVCFCGDFNSTPEMGVHRLLTNGWVGENDADWRNGEFIGFSGRRVDMPFRLNCLSDIETASNVTEGFTGCLDYIYANDELKVRRCFAPPSVDVLKEHRGLPSVNAPSDHIPLVMDVEFVGGSGRPSA